jgi:hypothetical protein
MRLRQRRSEACVMGFDMPSRIEAAMRATPLPTLAIALFLVASIQAASAQGFPGGGHGMGGRGARQPHEATQQPASTSAQGVANPLLAFLRGVRPLRMELLVRTEQVDAWTAMQDALVTVAEAERDASAPASGSSDPSVRLSAFVDHLDHRADATKAASERIAAVLAVLDDHQKQIFLARLSDALAGANPPQP